jgi:methionine-rich copper-binding protein CopC
VRSAAVARAAGLAIGLALLATFALADSASAHNQVVSSTPASGQTLTTLPPQFTIVTNESLLDPDGSGRGFAFEIRDARGRFYEDGCVSITDATMATTARLGAPGAYTVIYQLVSADGHTVSGEIPFMWAPSSSGSATVTTGTAKPSSCPGSTVKAQAPSDSGGSEATRNSTVPLGDVLFIGGLLVVIALAVVITLVIVTRRRRAADDDSLDEV